MSVPLIVWSCTAGTLAVAALAGVVNLVCDCVKRRWLQTGSERELLFIPGDPVRDDDNDYDCTE